MAIILGDTFSYSSRLFTVSRSDEGLVTLVAEASTLGYREPRQIYDDACDVGIAVRSERTGKLVRFYLSGRDMVDDEDVAGWRFDPIPEDARRCPGVAGTSILIIND